MYGIMRYEDFRVIEVTVKNARNRLDEGKALFVRVDLDNLAHYEGEFKDMITMERMIRLTTDKSVKFVAIQQIVAISYWAEEEV